MDCSQQSHKRPAFSFAFGSKEADVWEAFMDLDEESQLKWLNRY
jgi:hypothetical protein